MIDWEYKYRTLPELVHAVLCTTVPVTVAVYFEPVCVCFSFH